VLGASTAIVKLPAALDSQKGRVSIWFLYRRGISAQHNVPAPIWIAELGHS